MAARRFSSNATWSRRAVGIDTARRTLPVADGAVRVEAALQQLLLKRVFSHFGLVDLDAQTWPGAGPHQAPVALDDEALGDHVLAPGHVLVHRLADDVRRRGEAQL